MGLRDLTAILVGAAASLGGLALCFVVGGAMPVDWTVLRFATFPRLQKAAFARTAPQSTPAASQADHLPPLSAVLEAHQWINGEPHAADLRGKVVLVYFWTYSCINSLRPLRYLRAWAQKYRSQGFVVLGVHSPEFAFEKDQANVRKAVSALNLNFPVALDSDLAVWRSFRNQAWPGFYFVGADGRIRHRVLGENDYPGSEHVIQALLAEAVAMAPAAEIAAIPGSGIEAAPDWDDLRSPETYLGYEQAQNFLAPGGIRPDRATDYAVPGELLLNQWSLSGRWQITSEFAALTRRAGSIALRFHARDLNLVLATASGLEPLRFRITLDDAPPGADHGLDTDEQGWGIVTDDRLYQLVRQTRTVADRTFAIEFFVPGARAYSFTFG